MKAGVSENEDSKMQTLYQLRQLKQYRSKACYELVLPYNEYASTTAYREMTGE